MAPGRGFRGGFSSGRGGRGRGGPPRQNTRPTHFLCIPLANSATRSQLQRGLQQFETTIARANGRSGPPIRIPTSAVRPVDTLHFTLGVMTLESETKLQEAIHCLHGLNLKELLSSLNSSSPSTRGDLTISIESLTSMHIPTDTSILYAEPRDLSNRFQNFAEQIATVFKEKRFITETRPLKLHATVFNTVYSGKDRTGRKYQIDATELIELCKDFIWATDVAIDKIAICKMGAKKEYDDGGNVVREKYEEVAYVNI
jgi:activating signal cointegrator complex subunit 1